MTKKELLVLRREKDKLERTLGGIRDMSRIPSAVWIVDTNKEAIAVGEARKLGIPVIAILDSNCDPDVVDFPIPGNDDAIRAVGLLTRVIADAVAEGLMSRATGAGTAAAEPLAEWEAELLAAHESEQAAAQPEPEPEPEPVAAEAEPIAAEAEPVAAEAEPVAVEAEAVAEVPAEPAPEVTGESAPEAAAPEAAAPESAPEATATEQSAE
jgi:small subunit ribosomal protein S2